MVVNNMSEVLPKMRLSMKILSILAFMVSVTYTIKFNVGTAVTLDDKILSGATGFLQDATEVGFALFGFAILSEWSKQTKVMRFIALICISLSLTLILWSITSTWGANSAMIDGSNAASQYEQKKLAMIEDTMRLNQQAASNMEANAAMIREKAGSYSTKYTTRAIEKIGEAQMVSEKAGALASQNMQALDRISEIDSELISKVNSASAAFTRLATFFKSDTNTVGTTFLLTRATQLELIGIFAALFVILVPPAPKKKKENKRVNTEQASQPKKAPMADYDNAVSAKTNSVSTVPTNLKQGSTELLTDTDNTDTVEVKELKNFGFPSASKQNGRPLSVPVQSKTDTKTNTESYAKFISNVKSGMFKGERSDIAARQCKDWISSELNISKSKSQKLYEEWLDKAGNAGELKRNPKWTESSRTNKWSIK